MKSVIFNPYAGVNFANRYKANYHTHTRQSYGDGYNLLPNGVADFYANFGYNILSITDHDSLNTPRIGICNTNGTAVVLTSGNVVTYGGILIQAGESDKILINSIEYTIAEVVDATNLILTSSAGVQNGVSWRYDFINTPSPNWLGIPTWALSQWHDASPDSGNDVAEIYSELGTTEDKTMVLVAGNEISAGHHRNSLFTRMWLETGQDWAQRAGVTYTLNEIKTLGGISFLCHPGRYTQWDQSIISPSFTVQWYVNQFNDFDNCVGLEVFNAGDRYNCDRVLWDAVLLEMMPERPVFGLSNTDDHAVNSRCGINYNIHLLPELSEQAIRDSLANGTFYFVYDRQGTNIERHDPIAAPIINSIDVTEEHIEIDADNYTEIQWISGCNVETFESTVVYTGDSLPLNTPGLQNYVRAVLIGDNADTYTQPFGLSTAEAGSTLIRRFGGQLQTLQAIRRMDSEIQTLDIFYKPVQQ